MVDAEGIEVEDELRCIVRRLGGTDAQERWSGLETLHGFLQQNSLDEAEMMRLWKGVFYGLWLTPGTKNQVGDVGHVEKVVCCRSMFGLAAVNGNLWFQNVFATGWCSDGVADLEGFVCVHDGCVLVVWCFVLFTIEVRISETCASLIGFGLSRALLLGNILWYAVRHVIGNWVTL